MERAERVAIYAFITGLGVAVLSMAGPVAFDVPRVVWRVLFWIGAVISITSSGFMLYEYRQYARAKRVTPLVGMIICGLGFLACASWYFWPVATADKEKAAQGLATTTVEQRLPILAVNCYLAQLPNTMPNDGLNTLSLSYDPAMGESGPIGLRGNTSTPGAKLTWFDDRVMFPIMKCEISNQASSTMYSLNILLKVRFSEAIQKDNVTEAGALVKEREWAIAFAKLDAGQSVSFFAYNESRYMAYVTFPGTAKYFVPETNEYNEARLLILNWQAMSFAPATIKPTNK